MSKATYKMENSGKEALAFVFFTVNIVKHHSLASISWMNFHFFYIFSIQKNKVWIELQIKIDVTKL